MTWPQVRRVVSAVRLGGMLTGWRFEVSRHPSRDDVEFLLCGPVPDATAKDAGPRTHFIYFVENVREELVMVMRARDLVRFLRGITHHLMLHEADEALTVKGFRPFNPHRFDVPPAK